MKIIAPIAAGVLLAMAGAAQAATKTSSFTVSATVASNCLISAANLDLGTFDGTNDLDTATSNITVRCTTGLPFSVGLSEGLHGSFANRKLKIAGTDPDTLVYNLYTDSARTIIWNETTNRSGGIGAGMSSGSAVTVPVYGKLLASENDGLGKAGLYNDTIVATITY
jgi:spore coat protein U-like protein